MNRFCTHSIQTLIKNLVLQNQEHRNRRSWKNLKSRRNIRSSRIRKSRLEVQKRSSSTTLVFLFLLKLTERCHEGPMSTQGSVLAAWCSGSDPPSAPGSLHR